MTTRLRAVTALVALLALVSACGQGRGVDPQPAPDVASGDAAVRIVPEKEADLVLHVSNQSFDDERVRLTVAVDGVVVVDDDFDVEGQHTWIRFPLAMRSGAHEVTASSDTGAELTESFRVPGDAPRFAVLDHWGEEGTADLSWSFHRRPVAFA